MRYTGAGASRRTGRWQAANTPLLTAECLMVSPPIRFSSWFSDTLQIEDQRKEGCEVFRHHRSRSPTRFRQISDLGRPSFAGEERMWRLARAAANRATQIRRFSSPVIPGPCIVHKHSTDILHDPWFNKVPEIRTGFIKDGKPIQLKKWQDITISTDYTMKGDENTVCYKRLAEDMKPDSVILCADGTITLTVLSCDKERGSSL